MQALHSLFLFPPSFPPSLPSSPFLLPTQEIEKELSAHSHDMENVRLAAHQLLQGVGGCNLNTKAVHGKLDNMNKRWDLLQQLASER